MWHVYWCKQACVCVCFFYSTFFVLVSLPARAPKDGAPECGTAIPCLCAIYHLLFLYLSNFHRQCKFDFNQKSNNLSNNK